MILINSEKNWHGCQNCSKTIDADMEPCFKWNGTTDGGKRRHPEIVPINIDDMYYCITCCNNILNHVPGISNNYTLDDFTIV